MKRKSLANNFHNIETKQRKFFLNYSFCNYFSPDRVHYY